MLEILNTLFPSPSEKLMAVSILVISCTTLYIAFWFLNELKKEEQTSIQKQ